MSRCWCTRGLAVAGIAAAFWGGKPCLAVCYCDLDSDGAHGNVHGHEACGQDICVHLLLLGLLLECCCICCCRGCLLYWCLPAGV